MLVVGKTADLVVRHLVIADGTTAAYGGGIANNGTLTLIDSVVKGSTAYYGGGISNDGSLNLTDAVVRGNGAGVSGGGTLTMIRSVARDNRTDAGSGGGIASLGALTLTDSVHPGQHRVQRRRHPQLGRPDPASVLAGDGQHGDRVGWRRLEQRGLRPRRRHRHRPRWLLGDRQHPRRLRRHHGLLTC